MGSNLKPWFSLGAQPPANNLLTDPHSSEVFYPLTVYDCKDCELVQLLDIVDPDILFKDYLYYSSTSAVFRKHFEDFAKNCLKKGIVLKGDLVVDIGSNDGIMLKPFLKHARVVGVEPAKEIALEATKNGVLTYPDYFTTEVAEKIVRDFGKADLITATNVFAHSNELDEICKGVKVLLAPHGFFVIEVAYLPEMLKAGTFDLIYHEHICYYTIHSIGVLLARNGFFVETVERIPTHGGSIRVHARKREGKVTYLGEDLGTTQREEFINFPKKIEENKRKIKTFFETAKLEEKRIIGYGAPAKMSTMTNYFNLGPDEIDYIIDDSPPKQGKFSPGKHIPIVAPKEDMSNCTHDYMFIFAWNFAESIMKTVRERGYKGKFVIPFPELKVI